jgi:hypothetical protein
MASILVRPAPAAIPAPAGSPATLLDLKRAIHYALLVQLAEAVGASEVVYNPGKVFNVDYEGMNVTYNAVATFYANDIATEINPGRGTFIVSFGFVAQDASGNVVVAIRGTEGIKEWVQDSRFLALKCPFLPGSGLTENGFTSVYESLRIEREPASKRLITTLSTLPYPVPPTSLTICGHSLGGAVATLLALDVAANAGFLQPTVYTYASPRTGDLQFAATYNQVVPHTYRIANRLDIVPKLPLPPLYEHVLGIYDLRNPFLQMKFDLLCEHHLTTYLHFLSLQAGGAALPLNPECQP